MVGACVSTSIPYIQASYEKNNRSNGAEVAEAEVSERVKVEGTVMYRVDVSISIF